MLEPGFLETIQSGDYDQFTLPVQEVLSHTNRAKAEIERVVTWTEEFRQALETYPLLRVEEIDNKVRRQHQITFLIDEFFENIYFSTLGSKGIVVSYIVFLKSP